MNKKKIIKKLIPSVIWKQLRLHQILKRHSEISNKLHYLIDNCARLNNIDLCKIQFTLTTDKPIIWQYWDTGFENCPDLVKFCANSVNEFAKDDFIIIRIDQNNIDKYVKLPYWLKKKVKNHQISQSHFSDILRCILLYHYGGLWLDACILLTGGVPKYVTSKDFFIYQRDPQEKYKDYWENTFSYYFGWDRKFKVNHLIGIMYSSQRNSTTRDLVNILLEFWKSNDRAPDYFFFQIIINEYFEENPSKKIEIYNDCVPHMLRQYINGNPSPYGNIDEIRALTSIHSLNYKNPNANVILQKLLNKTR